jgi:UDP-N-acetylmuramoyl-tripeptide--D-alanyl-D-alanine ligase
MLPLKLSEVAAACGGRLVCKDESVEVRGVSIDSRTLSPGDLFIGLRGEHDDGGDFAGAALRAGAAAVVVRAETAAKLPPGGAHIVVDDGRVALARLASAVRTRSGALVVAITGSAGKTSTKDILTALLRPVAEVVATRQNFNNEIGVPLTLLAAEHRTEVIVTELAMRGAGQIRDLARIARPNLGVITNVAPVHLELVGGMEDVAAAKAELIEELGEGTVVVPEAEPLLDAHVRRHRGRVVTFGDPDGDVRAVENQRRGSGTHALIDAFGHRAAFDFNFTGEHYLTDALAAIAAFVELGYRLEEAKAGAAQVQFSALRGEIVALAGGGLMLNDTYNASPISATAAVDHLLGIADGRPPVAILGDMYELGPGAPAFHRAVGEYVGRAGVRLIAVGDLGRNYLAGAAGERWFATVEACMEALPEVVPAGSAVLVKASRAMHLERIADALRRPAGEREESTDV